MNSTVRSSGWIRMGKSVVDWNWRCAHTREPLLGPRDWSPKVEAAVRDLKLKESLLPQHMRLTEERLSAAPPMLYNAVKEGTAFIAEVGMTHEIVFVCPQGLVLMSDLMKALFDSIHEEFVE